MYDERYSEQWAKSSVKIITARKKKGWSQAELSKNAKCSIDTIRALESGKKNPANMCKRTISSICNALCITEAEIISTPRTISPRAPLKDLTGQTFGKLKVISASHKGRGSRTHWLCKCSCGKEVIVNGRGLTSGKRKSCGCMKSENSKKSMAFLHDNNIFEGRSISAIESTKPMPTNKSTGVRGVSYLKTRGVYEAYLRANGYLHQKTFTCLEDAMEYRKYLEETYSKPVLERYKSKINEKQKTDKKPI